MGGKNFNQLDSEQESLQNMTKGRIPQEISSFAADTTIALKAPSIIVNAGAVAGVIAYKTTDYSSSYVSEYFAAGQERRRDVTVVGSTVNGTAAGITKVVVWES